MLLPRDVLIENSSNRSSNYTSSTIMSYKVSAKVNKNFGKYQRQ